MIEDVVDWRTVRVDKRPQHFTDSTTRVEFGQAFINAVNPYQLGPQRHVATGNDGNVRLSGTFHDFIDAAVGEQEFSRFSMLGQ